MFLLVEKFMDVPADWAKMQLLSGGFITFISGRALSLFIPPHCPSWWFFVAHLACPFETEKHLFIYFSVRILLCIFVVEKLHINIFKDC